jgi:ribokinase
MTRLAVVGHVEWVDFIPVPRMPREGEVLHADGPAFTRAAGGGGVAAVVLAELGSAVDFFCALGEDAHGHAAAAQLGGRGVTVHPAWRVREPTRRAVTLLEDGGERTIVTVGERLEPRGADDLPWEVLASGAGGGGARVEGVEGVYFTAGDVGALERARRAPTVVASPRGRSALERGPEIDALVYSGGDPDEVDWARRLGGKARVLVETRGAAGGVWRSGASSPGGVSSGASEGSWKAVPPDRPVRDSYGCGDSFAAAFTFALAAGATVEEACELGARIGVRCLTRVGAP